MARNASVPYFDHGDTITAHAAADLFGRRFVAIDGPRTDGNPTVNYPEAGAKVFGVSSYDVRAGGKVTIHHQDALVVPVTAGGNVGAGDLVTSDAQGRAVTATGSAPVLGISLDAGAEGEDLPIDRSVRA
jgi:predicted RecA/RadA family phage recombinase